SDGDDSDEGEDDSNGGDSDEEDENPDEDENNDDNGDDSSDNDENDSDDVEEPDVVELDLTDVDSVDLQPELLQLLQDGHVVVLTKDGIQLELTGDLFENVEDPVTVNIVEQERSEERRVGKECR